MLDRLLWFKYTNDSSAGKELYYYLLCDVFIKQLLAEDLPMDKLLGDIKTNRGVLQRCCTVVMDEICRPELYKARSAREWARVLGLKNYKQWQQVWQKRYQKLWMVLQELDSAINKQIVSKL